MRHLGLAVLGLVVSFAGAAEAQEYVSGGYDARNVAGWVHDPSLTQVAGLPSWTPAPSTGLPNYVNCNLGHDPLNVSAADVDTYLSTVTPRSFGNSVRGAGTQIQEVIATVRTTEDGYPAQLSVLVSGIDGQPYRHIQLQVFVPNRLVTATCTTDMNPNEAVWDGIHGFLHAVRYGAN